MSVIFFSIPVGIIFLLIAIWAFFWAVDSGQYDDLDSPAYQPLLDDEPLPGEKTKRSEQEVEPEADTRDENTNNKSSR
ncbi:cbb3-type cytochrome oxidase assembly protein CcoS [Alkalilimnicola ehrlichii MLHE-1]|uniref:Cytochrome oxidase maturation protein, cbb3-type n=1 Tax=Alkalilimnicola ehrlichii (strain ATCC BAA-1101 / DSM 17681 / MLHE-1) TaxID=187272 RepID=Q0A7G9_ALKEH|nr:cbb3-type cytochrome oxidase assembly protein CcoS [Alkalilimnicola ehrlichii]ABI57218.1 cytochrome oxidase maturation protein, cbb3-type [Alkalilimnicola ehrlichii MLHE-1]